MTQHILALARTLPFHSIGGMQSIAWDLLRRFAQQGSRVSVLTTWVPGQDAPFHMDGVTVVPVPETTPERCNDKWWKGSRKEAERILKIAPPSVVFSVSSAGAGLLPLRPAMPGVPFVFQAHGTSWGELISKWRTRHPVQMIKSLRNAYWLLKDVGIYKQFDAIALVGDVIEEQFRRPPLSWFVKSIRRVIIRNGIDTSIFQFSEKDRAFHRERWGWDGGDPVFVFAARLHAQKGLHQTINAFRLLHEDMPSARLLIIGDGDERQAAEEKTASFGNSVRFVGGVPRASVPGLLSAADIFVFPTLRQEGLPMNVLEALAIGLPVVTSEEMREVLPSDLEVTYVPSQETNRLAKSMWRCVVAGPRDGISRLPHLLSLDHCAESYLQLFSDLQAK